ncbi:putative ribonuclease H-like domain-containing protein [Tanacetum coccineum]|uniref:Ribonuclease H-like domain-containing protein n=1 Tax=Tanacetum coccineum TaxID=301880 RepID=A0ABQ5G1H8_9ASTR
MQGNRSVEVYTTEFNRLSSRNDLSKTESQQVTRYVNGLSPEIQDRISLVPIYTLDDAYNLAVRAQNQLAKRTRPRHRSSDCRGTGRKVNLTLKEDKYDEEEENDEDSDGEEDDTDMCHPESGFANDEYTTQSCVIRHIMLTPNVNEPSQRHNIFRTWCVFYENIFNVIIDNRSTKNIVSRDIVQRLKLPTEKHPNPYRIGWIKSVGKINITKRCKVPFTIGKYKDEVVCDIVDMDACHIFLGRPWEFDVNATHKGKDNTYSFRVNGVKKILFQEMEDLKQHYLDEMLSLSNDLRIKDYRNEKIDIRFRRECEDMIDELKGKFNRMSIEINKKIELQRLESIPLRDIFSELPLSIAITFVLPTLEPEDSLIMGDEELITIPEKESDEFIKSSVEDLVPIPNESKDTSKSDSDCDLLLCDNFSPINVYEEKSVTFSNPLFDSNDDFTSRNDESLSDDDVPEENVKIYSNPLCKFNDEYISGAVNPLFDEVLEDIESKDSYVSNLDKPALLVTPLFDSNEDKCFIPSDDVELLLHRDSSTPMISIVSILEGLTDEPPLEENDDLFDLESKKNEWKKILYDDLIDDLIFDPGGDIDEIDAFLDIDISTNIKDGFYESEEDVLYLESLLSDDTTPSPLFEVFLDRDPRSLSDIDNLKNIVKNCPDYEDSRAHGFVHRSLDLQSLACLYMGIRYPRSY